MRTEFLSQPCEASGKLLKFKTLGFWDVLPVCRDCRATLRLGELCYVCSIYGSVRCPSCEFRAVRDGCICLRWGGAHGHTPVWVNLEREAKFGEDEKHESSR
jgi:hypothetical protein